MQLLSNSQEVVELIQLALAPVFLLVGIAQFINVVTGRVARIIDRSRNLGEQNAGNDFHRDSKLCQELRNLSKRLKFANWSVNSLVGSAVLICIDIIVLIASGVFSYSFETPIMVLFVSSITCITAGLVFFFLEVSVATATLKVDLDKQ